MTIRELINELSMIKDQDQEVAIRLEYDGSVNGISATLESERFHLTQGNNNIFIDAYAN